MSRLGKAVASVPGGTGIFYWAPEWVPSTRFGGHLVTGWDNVTLFDFFQYKGENNKSHAPNLV